MDQLVKQITSVTVKFSNDKLLKAAGLLRDANALYKDGLKKKQGDFQPLFSILESIKSDRSTPINLLPFVDAIGALLPAFAGWVLSRDVNLKEHLESCRESTLYYTNKITKNAKESNDEKSLEWVESLLTLMNALINGYKEKTDSSLTFPTKGNVDSGSLKEKEEFDSKIPNRPALNSPGGSGTILQNSPVKSMSKSFSTSSQKLASTIDPNAAPQLEGNRWYLRRAGPPPSTSSIDAAIINITPTSLNQAIALEDCHGAVVSVPSSKLATIIMDHCYRTNLNIEADIVSQVELIGCQRGKIWLKGKIPTLVLDECEGLEIWIGESSQNVTILSSKCAEINIIVDRKGSTDENGDDDQVELALPVQFKTTIITTDIVPSLYTEPVQHVGV